jgi:hypothetical protein
MLFGLNNFQFEEKYTCMQPAGGRRSRERMVFGFTTTYAISTYLILWVRISIRAMCTPLCDLRQVGGFRQVLRFPPQIKPMAMI